MNNFPAMHFPLGVRGNNFDSQIKIIYSWSKMIPFASSGPFCACGLCNRNLFAHSHFLSLQIDSSSASGEHTHFFKIANAFSDLHYNLSPPDTIRETIAAATTTTLTWIQKVSIAKQFVSIIGTTINVDAASLSKTRSRTHAQQTTVGRVAAALSLRSQLPHSRARRDRRISRRGEKERERERDRERERERETEREREERI